MSPIASNLPNMKIRVVQISLLIVTLNILLSPIPSFAQDPSYWLPIHKVTAGAINPAVTQENISKTICTAGYTATIRPKSSFTTALKKKQLVSTYSRYGSTSTSLVEEDHLIPLEVGGNPSSVQNLWPQLWTGDFGARKKDALENKIHKMVCSNQITLKFAQALFATDWVEAYKVYVLGLTSTPTTTVTPSDTPTPNATVPSGAIPSPNATVPSGATGLCNDGTYSFSATHSGMCSRHGGVSRYYP
jgi:hypothetical protein